MQCGLRARGGASYSGLCRASMVSLSPVHTDKVFPDADLQGSSSDSEGELMGQYQEAVTRSQGLRGGAKAAAHPKAPGGFRWGSRQKYSRLTADHDGYSSEASADDGMTCELF